MRVEISEQTSAVENFRLLLSRRSAARALDISVRMIDYAIAAGLIESRRINSRILIPSESLMKFAAADRVIPRASAHCQEYA